MHYNNKKTFFEDDIKFEYCVFGYLSWKSDSGQLYKAIAYLLGDDRKVHIIPCNSCAGSKLQSCRYIAKFSMAVRKCTVSSFFFHYYFSDTHLDLFVRIKILFTFVERP